MQDDPRHSRNQRRLDDEGPPQRARAVLPSEIAGIALVRAVAELYADELLERAGYLPEVDDREHLLNEITMEAECRALHTRTDLSTELLEVIDDARDDDDDPQEVLGSDRV